MGKKPLKLKTTNNSLYDCLEAINRINEMYYRPQKILVLQIEFNMRCMILSTSGSTYSFNNSYLYMTQLSKLQIETIGNLSQDFKAPNARQQEPYASPQNGHQGKLPTIIY